MEGLRGSVIISSPGVMTHPLHLPKHSRRARTDVKQNDDDNVPLQTCFQNLCLYKHSYLVSKVESVCSTVRLQLHSMKHGFTQSFSPHFILMS